LPPAHGRLEGWVVEGIVDRIMVVPGGTGLVDAVQRSLVEDHLGRCQLALQLLHDPRPDERRGTGGVIEGEGDRELDEGAPQRAAARSTVRAGSVADATPDDRLYHQLGKRQGVRIRRSRWSDTVLNRT
jgi:hypothetical protein